MAAARGESARRAVGRFGEEALGEERRAVANGSGMGQRSRRYADYVGRVGALAVALGVGAAVVLSTPAVAVAEPSDDSSSSESSSSASTGSESASDSTSSDSEQDPSEDSPDESEDADDPSPEPTEPSDVEDDEDVEPPTETTPDEPEVESELPDAPVAVDPETAEPQPDAGPTVPVDDSDVDGGDAADTRVTSAADEADEAPAEEVASADATVAGAVDDAVVTASVTTFETATARPLSDIDSLVEPTARPTPPPPSVGPITGLVVAVMRAFGLDASATTVPHHPVATVGWTLLAFVRREIQTLLDRKPVIHVTAAPGQDGAVNLLVTTSDPDRHDVVTVSATSPSHGTLVHVGDGHWTYTPDSDYAHELSLGGSTVAGTDTFTFVATDRFGKSVTETRTVRIAPQNDAPDIESVQTTLNEDGTTTIAVLASDTDDDTVTSTAVGALHGTVAKNLDGSFTYTPDSDYALSLGEGGSTVPGTDVVTIAVTDGYGGLTTIEQDVTITPQYLVPIVTLVTPTQGTSGSTVLAVKTSYNDGQPVTVDAGGTVYGTVTSNVDGTFTYVPDPVYAHAAAADGAEPVTDSVTFTVTDENGAQTYHTAALIVTPQNEAPEISGVTTTANTDGTTTLIVAGRVDEDGDVVVVTAGGVTKGSVVTNADGSFSYIPTADATGTDTVYFTATDGHGGQTVTSALVSASVPQVGTPGYSSVVNSSTGVVTGTVNVTDDGPLTYSLGEAPDSTLGTVVVDATTGAWTYTPSALARMTSYYTDDDEVTFVINASDGTATIPVTVTASVKPSSAAVMDTISLSQGAPIAIATNADGTRVYVTGSGTNTVPVLEADNDHALQTSLDTDRSKPFDVTVSGDYAYVSNYGSNSVSIIDTTDNEVVATIAVGTKPTNLAASPDGTRLYVTNSVSNDISVIDIDPTSSTYRTVVKTVSVGTEPLGVTVSADGTRAYVANSVSGTVSVINTETYAVVRTITVGSHPHSLAVSDDGTRLYVTNYGVSTDSGTVSVIDIDPSSTTVNRVITTIDTGQKGSYDIAVAGRLAFVTNLVSGTVSVIDTETNTAVGNFRVGNSPYGVTVNPDTGSIYVANWGDNTVSVASANVSSTVPDAALSSVTPTASTVEALSTQDEQLGYALSEAATGGEPVLASSTPVAIQAAASSSGTTTFTVTNVSQYPVTFLGYYSDSDFTTMTQAGNITLMPGETQYISVPDDRPSNTFVAYQSSNGARYELGLSYVYGADRHYSGCRVSGAGACSVDLADQTDTVLLEGEAGTVVTYAADQVQEQGELVDRLCSSGGATCTFTPVSYVDTYGAPHLPTNFSPLNNTQASTSNQFDYTMTDTVTDTTSFTVTSTTLVGVKDVASTSVALAFGQSVATTNTFTETFRITVPAGEVGYLYYEAPVRRYNGTWTISAPNTTWHMQGTYYEVPIPGGTGVYTVTYEELNT